MMYHFDIFAYFFADHDVTSISMQPGWLNDDFIYNRYRFNLRIEIHDKSYQMQFVIHEYEGPISESILSRLFVYKAAKEMFHRLCNAHVAHPDFVEHLGTVEYFKK